jgi:membrane protease subunit (stomatin/prohibitin family)
VAWQILPKSQKQYTAEEVSVNYCGNCGAKRKKDSFKFCPHCGTKF